MKRILFATLLSLITAVANSAVIYDNGNPDVSNGLPIYGYGGSSDDFTIDEGGTVKSVSFYLLNERGYDYRFKTSYSLFSDNAGDIGTLLASGVGQNYASSLTSYPTCCWGMNAVLVKFDLQNDFVAVAGTTYWLNLHGAGWEYAPSSYWVTAPLNGQYGARSGGHPSNVDASFFLSGDLNASVGSVPIPAAAWLLGSGLLGLIGVARRKAA